MRNHTRTGAAAVATIALAFAVGTAAAGTGSPATFAEALDQASDESKLLIVDFFTEW